MSMHLNAWWHDFPLWLRQGRCVAAVHPPAYPLRVKRGIEGDFWRVNFSNPLKSPLAPLFQSGEYR